MRVWRFTREQIAAGMNGSPVWFPRRIQGLQGSTIHMAFPILLVNLKAPLWCFSKFLSIIGFGVPGLASECAHLIHSQDKGLLWPCDTILESIDFDLCSARNQSETAETRSGINCAPPKDGCGNLG